MDIIGKRMKESCLETLTAKVMERRKLYHRDDRGHRITLEAFRKTEILFLKLLKDKEHDLFNQVTEKINNIKEDIYSLFGKNPK